MGEPVAAQANHATGDGTRRVLRNTAALTAARIVERGATLVLALLVAAALGADGLGAYSVAMALLTTIGLFGESGTTMYLIRELARTPERTGSYVVHLSVVVGALSCVIAAATVLVVGHVGYAPEMASAVAVVALALPGRTLNSIQEAAFVAHGRTELEAITTFVTTSLYVAVSAWLLHTGHGVATVLAAYVVLEYVSTITYFVLIRRFIGPLPLRFAPRLARRLLWDMRSFAGSSALAALLSRPEVLLLSAMATPAQVGYYGAAVRVAEVWQFVPQVFMNNVYPLLSRSFHRHDGRFAAIQRKATQAVLAYTLPLTGGLLAAAPQIVPALFGERFAPAVALLRILGLNITFAALSSVFWRSLAARGRQDQVLRVQIAMVGVRLGGGALLIAVAGAAGAAWSSSLASALTFVLLAAATLLSGAAIPSPLVAWRFAAAATLMAVVTAVAAPSVSLWLLVPAAAATYLGGSIVLRAVSLQQLRVLRRSWTPAHAGPR